MGFFSAIKKFFGQEGKDSSEKTEIPVTSPEQQTVPLPVNEEIGPENKVRLEENGALQPGLPEKNNMDSSLTDDVETTGKEVENESASLVLQDRPDIPFAVNVSKETPVKGESDELLVKLRAAEPGLGNWLDIILEGVTEANDLFWERLVFLLDSLEAPKNEIDAFTDDFRKWLEAMEYHQLDEFRSELQYRLALALELEDEEDERNRLLAKLSATLGKTREQLGKSLNRLFSSHTSLSQDFWDELEEMFIMADLGYETSMELVKRLQDAAARENIQNPGDVRKLLHIELEQIFARPRGIKSVNKPEVILMIGVNGVGKTTTIAKLAYRDKLLGKKTLIVAADTFRAAAIEQLEVWANRAGVDFFSKKAGSDPASVAWEAMDYALKNNIDSVYIDTAGRLQTKVNLMEELSKIRQVLAKKHPGAPHRSVLVLDATTGQNALSQAKLFKNAAGVNELILTKLDGTAKGGVAIAVAMQENVPISYIGLGEKMEDLRPFDGKDYADALLGKENGAEN